jgi:hypothetical protein
MSKQTFSKFALAFAAVLAFSNFAHASSHQTTAPSSHSSAWPGGGAPAPTGGPGGNT